MQNATLWRALLGIEKAVIEDIEFDEDRAAAGGSCSSSETGAGSVWAVWAALAWPMTVARDGVGGGRWTWARSRRCWRPRRPGSRCREHGPTVAAVPWARHAAGHTYAFDEQVAWLATQCSKSAITELMRIAWRTVGAIITRVWADVEAVHDRFAGPEADRDR